jgi:predicted esterase
MGDHLEPIQYGVRPTDAKVLCVFVHGRTQSPEDMIEHIVGKCAGDDIAFVLPRARDNSWYAARATDPLSEETRRQLGASLDYIHGIVRTLRQAGGVNKPILMGGFSQGACLTLEYAMKFGPWNGAMVNLTGCRVGQQTDTRPLADLNNMPVYLTGSDGDPWIPVTAFAEASEALGKARAKLRCELFPGREHQASAMEVAAFGAILADLARGEQPFQRLAA